jgi:hypothetical protein
MFSGYVVAGLMLYAFMAGIYFSAASDILDGSGFSRLHSFWIAAIWPVILVSGIVSNALNPDGIE